MDSARVFPCMVCTKKHMISRKEKKKMMMNLVDSNIDLIKDISTYNCLRNASTSNHFLTTRLQYRTLKYLGAIYSIIYKLSLQQSLKPYPISRLQYTGRPMKHYERSKLFSDFCEKIIEQTYVLGDHFLKIETDDNLWRFSNDKAIFLLKRINRFLWTYALTYHAKKCKDCSN